MTFYPNEVIKINRKYIEADLNNIESKLLNENGQLDDDIFDAIANELFENVDKFIKGCYLNVENDKAREKQDDGAETISPTLF